MVVLLVTSDDEGALTESKTWLPRRGPHNGDTRDTRAVDLLHKPAYHKDLHCLLYSTYSITPTRWSSPSTRAKGH
jgi:hypothetical protein